MTNFQSNENPSSSTKDKRARGIPLRFFLIFNSFFAFIIVYANKVVLSVAIVAMVSETPIYGNYQPVALALPHQNSSLPLHISNTSNISNATFAALHSGNAADDLDKPENGDFKSPSILTNQTTFKLAISNPDVTHKHKVNQVYYDHKTKSKVLGAFFWGYIVTQVPAGRLAERFGAKWLLGKCVWL